MSKTIESNELFNKINARLKKVQLNSLVDNEDGSFSMVLSGDRGDLDGLLSGRGVVYNELPYIDKNEVSKFIKPHTTRGVRKEIASTLYRDRLGADYLDLAVTPDVNKSPPQELYKRSVEYYRSRDVYGSSIDLLTNFASKGFRNDIDDVTIRNFYDNWIVDTGFDVTVDQIFFELFRSGFVRTLKVVGKYIPKINSVSTIPGQKVKKVKEDVACLLYDARGNKIDPSEFSAKKIKWSKDYIPIRYTILNPTQIEVDNSSILLDQQLIVLKAVALEGVKKLLERNQSDLTEYQKKILKDMSPEMRKAALAGEDLPLDPYLVGSVDYRRQPYENYPYPRGARAFESLEYKKSLRDADYSTLDGISNYILVITVGNDNFPLKSQDTLETVSALFDTPSKSFDVVWDHTLKVQRVQPTDVGDILGKEKYAQVNEDITGSFGVIRALIDGVGNPSAAGADLAVKAIVEEVRYARKQVARWIYREYRDVAEAMGFERYPKVRFDETILKDELMLMNVIMGMIDRRILSYRTGHDLLGFDHDTVLSELTMEKPLVQDGVLGIIGSPYNPQALPSSSTGTNVQDKQRTPKGTPSEGRPKNQPAKTPAPAEKTTTKKGKVSEENAKLLGKILDEMTLDEIQELLELIKDKVVEDK